MVPSYEMYAGRLPVASVCAWKELEDVLSCGTYEDVRWLALRPPRRMGMWGSVGSVSGRI